MKIRDLIYMCKWTRPWPEKQADRRLWSDGDLNWSIVVEAEAALTF